MPAEAPYTCVTNPGRPVALMTGATGFTDRYLCAALRSLGHRAAGPAQQPACSRANEVRRLCASDAKLRARIGQSPHIALETR